MVDFDFFHALIIYIYSDLSCVWFLLWQSQANLEIELEVLEDLQSMFSAMMENLGDTDFVDG